MVVSRFGFSASIFLAFALLSTPSVFSMDPEKGSDAESTLVRINFITETPCGEPVAVNGRRIPDYQPKIIQIFKSTGVVIDDESHILTFLGYRWVDMLSPNPSIEVVTHSGQRCKGKLVGIDQSVGAAVVAALEGRFSKTPLCQGCEIRDGATVVTRVLSEPNVPLFLEAQVVSVGREGEPRGQEVWEIPIGRPLPETGGLVFDTEQQVLGFIGSPGPSTDDPAGMRTIVYPIAQLLTSAQKILRAGGDIRTGWLGVFLDASPGSGAGVKIRSVLKDSPASKAGLLPEDVLMKWNGRDISNARQFIRMVQDTPIGARADVDVLRQNRRISVSALIEARRLQEPSARLAFNFPAPIEPSDSFHFHNSDARTMTSSSTGIGIETVPLTSQLADFLQMPGQTGLLVSGVEARTPFDRAGVQVGDVIVSVDRRTVLDPQNFVSLVRAGNNNSGRLLLKLLRKGTQFSTVIQLRQTPKP